jgi:hypothetical protein
MKLEDLMGSLRAHESILQEDKPVKKKMIALDTQTREHSQTDEDSLENDEVYTSQTPLSCEKLCYFNSYI